MWRSLRRSNPASDHDAGQRSPSEEDNKLVESSSNGEKCPADGVIRPVDTNDTGSSSVTRSSAAGNLLGKRELTVGEGWDYTGFAFPTWRKWTILTSVFIVQISMNYNASAYANAVSGLTEEYGISGFQARLGQMVFLVAYVSFISSRTRRETDKSAGYRL